MQNNMNVIEPNRSPGPNTIWNWSVRFGRFAAHVHTQTSSRNVQIEWRNRANATIVDSPAIKIIVHRKGVWRRNGLHVRFVRPSRKYQNGYASYRRRENRRRERHRPTPRDCGRLRVGRRSFSVRGNRTKTITTRQLFVCLFFSNISCFFLKNKCLFTDVLARWIPRFLGDHRGTVLGYDLSVSTDVRIQLFRSGFTNLPCNHSRRDITPVTFSIILHQTVLRRRTLAREPVVLRTKRFPTISTVFYARFFML